MSDMIDRQAAIDALAKNMPSWTTPDGSGQFDHDIQVTDEAYVDCMQIIHDMPSAQPERKKGEWIPVTNGRGGFECDQCHNYAPSYQDDVEWLSGFCPNCGADMRGEQDG